MVSKSAYVRLRVCSMCGKEENVRKDNLAEVCGRCSRSIAAASGAAKKRAAAIVSRPKCKNCGEKVKSAKAIFCSVGCKSEHARQDRQCKTCGQTFSLLRSSIGKSTNASGNFCSRKCYNKYLCNGEKTTGRGSQWKRIRGEVISEFPFCAKCGTTKNLQVHHITPFRLTRDNSKENLVPLCAKHHKEIEMMFVETERLGVTPETEMIWRNMIRTRQAATAMALIEVRRNAAA